MPRANLEQQLAARREQLQAEIRDKLAAAREIIGTRSIDQLIENGDAAAADFIADLDLAEVNRDLAELRAVTAALERLAAGTYGICADCGGPIAAARLDAHPTALRCVACQADYETRHGPAPTAKW